MDIIKQAIEFSSEFLAKNPGHVSEVKDLFSLMKSEIEEGGSPQSEYESFIQSVEQLLENN